MTENPGVGGMSEATRLLMSMLLQGGGELSGSPAIKAVGGVGNQYLAAQSMQSQQKEKYKWLADLLKSGGELKINANDAIIKAPAKSFSGPSIGGEETPIGLGGGAQPSLSSAGQTGQGIDPKLLMAILGGQGSGPTESPAGGSSASLVGLTPENLSQALTGAVQTETLKQNVIDAIAGREIQRGELGLRERQMQIDSMYRDGMLDVSSYNALTSRMTEDRLAGEQDPLDKLMPIQGTRRYTIREWNSLTPDLKEYEAYVSQSKELKPNEPVMSKEDWKRVDPSTRSQYLEELEKNPKLLAMEKQLANLKDPITAPKEPSPVTWAKSSDKLTERYGGRLNAENQFVIPEHNAIVHSKAQEFLVNLQEGGIENPDKPGERIPVSPLRAVVLAEKMANQWKNQIENKYFDYIDKANKIKDKKLREARINEVSSAFNRNYGYIPDRRK